VISWRRTTATGLSTDHKREIVDQSTPANIYCCKQGEVKWHNKIGHLDMSRRNWPGVHPEQGMWLKYVAAPRPKASTTRSMSKRCDS